MLKKSFMIVGLVVLSLGVFAQSVEDAGLQYNEGNEQMKAKDYSGAVMSFEQALAFTKANNSESTSSKSFTTKSVKQTKKLSNLTEEEALKHYK